VVGPLLKNTKGYLYILAAIYYFSKWAEAAVLKEVKKETVVNFIQINIIYRYRMPRHIITDNEKEFYNTTMNKLCAQFDFIFHLSNIVPILFIDFFFHFLDKFYFSISSLIILLHLIFIPDLILILLITIFFFWITGNFAC
jgi:hypothetical protein